MMAPDTLLFITNTMSAGGAIWALFFLALITFSIMSVVLFFHWTQYRMTSDVPKIIPALYLAVGLILLGLMASIAVLYSI